MPEVCSTGKLRLGVFSKFLFSCCMVFIFGGEEGKAGNFGSTGESLRVM